MCVSQEIELNDEFVLFTMYDTMIKEKVWKISFEFKISSLISTVSIDIWSHKHISSENDRYYNVEFSILVFSGVFPETHKPRLIQKVNGNFLCLWEGW